VAADGRRRSRRRVLAADRRAGEPADITQSLAKGARMHGAKFREGVRVTGFEMEGRRITR
jgi:glycine/D-amino acid oxidase-like deaminating enzyme